MNDESAPPVIKPPPGWVPWAVAGAAGFAGWWAACLASGLDEAWDSPAYGKIAYPLFAAVAGALGYWQRTHPWRWPLALAAGQAVALFTRGPIGNLAPLGLIAFVVLSAPLLIPAVLGARLRRWRDER